MVGNQKDRGAPEERLLPKRTPSIAVFTATRAEYGLLRGTLRQIRHDPALRLHLIVGGTHLSATHGMTADEIIADGFNIDARVPMRVETNTDLGVVQAMADCTTGMGEALMTLRPDLLLMLGDRYELLPAASLATVLRIPIAHVSGGDITEGAIDNQVRHALTKMAHLHLAGTQQAADRIIQMGEDPTRVIVTGQPGLDEFVEAPPMPRHELAANLGLDAAKGWVLFTYHPETLADDGVDLARIETALDILLKRSDLQTVLTASNADRGGNRINEVLTARAVDMPERFRFIPSLGHRRFVATMREVLCVMGNSSAGIIEAASVPVPAIDIGARQAGRLAPPNVLHAAGDRASLDNALVRAAEPSFRSGLARLKNPYGDGRAASRIKGALKDFLANPSVHKTFHQTSPGATR